MPFLKAANHTLAKLGRRLACALATLAMAGVSTGAAADPPKRLDQGWDPTLQELFYFTPQGSRMMPLSWFKALEQPGEGGALFSAMNYLQRFGFLEAEDGPAGLNAAGLPIGFAVDPVNKPGTGQWVGLTCAACHTGDLRHNGTAYRIDGAPANVDFDRFLAALATSVRQTAFEEDRRNRFLGRLTGGRQLPEPQMKRLQGQLAAFASTFIGRAALRSSLLESGPGRVDALTQIINSLAVVDLGVPDNYFPPAAPTSYPQLWLAPQLEFVQWSPIAASPMGRNAGEVLGVFGHANLQGAPETLFNSTARIGDLAKLESWVESLTPPKWPEDAFGALDEAKWREGKDIFDQGCAGCHNMPPYRMTDPSVNAFGMRFVEVGKIPAPVVGTDPAYIHSLTGRLVKTGDLAGLLFDGKPAVPGAVFFLRTVGAVVANQMRELELPDAAFAKLNGFRFRPPAAPGLQPEPYQPDAITNMKASPLVGVWATGPYLHNGSVPTVYDLLSPPDQRPKVFFTGGRDLDVVKLGFKSGGAPGRFRFDTSIYGNGNQGHAYPASGPLAHEQRLAVIEYLKDPERFLEGQGQ